MICGESNLEYYVHALIVIWVTQRKHDALPLCSKELKRRSWHQQNLNFSCMLVRVYSAMNKQRVINQQYYRNHFRCVIQPDLLFVYWKKRKHFRLKIHMFNVGVRNLIDLRTRNCLFFKCATIHYICGINDWFAWIRTPTFRNVYVRQSLNKCFSC